MDPRAVVRPYAVSLVAGAATSQSHATNTARRFNIRVRHALEKTPRGDDGHALNIRFAQSETKSVRSLL